MCSGKISQLLSASQLNTNSTKRGWILKILFFKSFSQIIDLIIVYKIIPNLFISGSKISLRSFLESGRP